MPTEKFDSTMKKTLESLCCSNGWCYGVIWGFDQRNSLLVTLKDAYCEEKMRALIDSMLLQAHVVGRGVIGQAAFAKNHRWVYSDAHHERQNLGSFDSLDVFTKEESEFFCQFSVGIKTIAVISVEPWGVVEFGSTHKNLERKEFIDQVKLLFRGMDLEAVENDPLPDSHFFHSGMELDSIFYSQGFMGEDHSLVLPSQPFPSNNRTPSSIENPIQTSSNPLEQFLLESDFFDCSATHQELSSYTDSSLLASSWPHLASGLEVSACFSEPRDQESCKDPILNMQSQQLSDLSNAQDFSSSISPTDFKPQRLSGLLTVEEFVAQSNSAKAESDFSQWISQHSGNALVSTDMSHSTGLMPGPCSSKRSTPIHKGDSFPTSSLQSTVTYAFRSSDEAKQLDSIGSKMCSSNSLFSKLGLDHLLGGIAKTSASYDRSEFENQPSFAAKRRKLDNLSWSQNQVKFEDPSLDRKVKSTYKLETKNSEANSQDSTKELPRSCIGDSCTSSSRRKEEVVKNKKKKAKPGTKPRPKDRQMIQDRLAELRELIPNGEKMSIDRLLERTIRHLNFMQSLTRHAESLKKTAKPKSMEEYRNQTINGGDGGATWAYEVGDDAMFCPLIVEDLGAPGQMLIEILCEEQGFFLEIVDIIRGFGLTILKGTMEARDTKKIWAHFMVQAEGSRGVTRHEIFSSLIQLLEMTGQSAGSAGGMPAFSNFEGSGSFSANFGDAGLQCASL